MKKNVLSVSADETVQSAAKLMRDGNIGFLPVCDDQKRVVGTLTDRDLTIDVLAVGLEPTTCIGTVAKSNVYSCAPDDDVQKAIDIMARSKKGRLVCLDTEDRLVGIVSLSDVAEQFSVQDATRTMREVSDRDGAMTGREVTP